MELNKIYHGDCLEIANEIESGSVDLILTDLPYGTIRGSLVEEKEKYKRLTMSDWDLVVEPKRVYEIANRILRKNGKMVLFSQEPYTTQLINETIPNVPFNYRMIWEKDHFANCLSAKKAPVSYYEDVLIFNKVHDSEGIHPLRPYFQHVINFIGLSKKSIIEKIGQKADHVFRTKSTQFSLCSENTYNELIRYYHIDRMDGFKTYDELVKLDTPSTFNLWEGKKYKSNILKYKKDYDGFHPTQKPILLLEDLIKTFSNKGDTVVDLTCGSGSTCVAARNTGRFFIGIEKEKEYVDIANARLKQLPI